MARDGQEGQAKRKAVRRSTAGIIGKIIASAWREPVIG